MSRRQVTVRFPNRLLLEMADAISSGPAYNFSHAVEDALGEKFGPKNPRSPRYGAVDGGASSLASPDDPNGKSRLTVRTDAELLERVDAFVEAGFYMNRSAAIRDACREKFVESRPPSRQLEDPRVVER